MQSQAELKTKKIERTDETDKAESTESVTLRLSNHEDPFSEVICQYFTSRFPKAIIPNSSQLLEILTLIIIGDKNLRVGPVPLPEQLVVIRKTIADSISINMPVPILVAWGGRKPDDSNIIDASEVAGIYIN